jgi:hypothetical protein
VPGFPYIGFIVYTVQPSYMYQTTSGYIFCLRIPKDLKSLAGNTEFRYSLRSAGLRLARQRAKCIASFVQLLFIKVRDDVGKYSPEYITRVIKYVLNVLKDDERCRATGGAHRSSGFMLLDQTMSPLGCASVSIEEAESLQRHSIKN